MQKMVQTGLHAVWSIGWIKSTTFHIGFVFLLPMVNALKSQMFIPRNTRGQKRSASGPRGKNNAA